MNQAVPDAPTARSDPLISRISFLKTAWVKARIPWPRIHDHHPLITLPPIPRTTIITSPTSRDSTGPTFEILCRARLWLWMAQVSKQPL